MGGGENKAEFRVNLAPQAYRSLSRLTKQDKALAMRISAKIDILSKGPMLGKPLKGPLKDQRSLRVGEYRVIYKLDIVSREILVTNVGHRRNVYSR